MSYQKVQGRSRRQRRGKRVLRINIIYLPYSLTTAEVKIAGVETKNKKHLVITSKVSCECLSEL